MKSNLTTALFIIVVLLLIWSLVLQSQVRQLNREIDSLENRIENLTKPIPSFPKFAVGGTNNEHI